MTEEDLPPLVPRVVGGTECKVSKWLFLLDTEHEIKVKFSRVPCETNRVDFG